MSRSVAEKTVCGECGADVRENTYFCYNCGQSVVDSSSQESTLTEEDLSSESEARPVEKPDILLEPPVSPKVNSKGKAALDRLAEQLSSDREPAEEKRIAEAAARRKRSRSIKKKGSEYTWEPVEDAPGGLLFVVVGFFVLLAVLAVITTVIWK